MEEAQGADALSAMFHAELEHEEAIVKPIRQPSPKRTASDQPRDHNRDHNKEQPRKKVSEQKRGSHEKVWLMHIPLVHPTRCTNVAVVG